MALAADQASAAWRAGPAYNPLLGMDAGSSWAASVELPQAPRYDTLLPGEAGSSWHGAKAYASLHASAADGQFAHSKPAVPVYQPLAAASADVSWLGAVPYVALLAGSADAQWIEQTAVDPSDNTATGFQATKFGVPERWIAPPAKVVRAEGWASGGFGQPHMLQIAAPVSAGVRFGSPRATFNSDIGGSGDPVQAQARGWRSGGFGRPQVQLKLQVQQQSAGPVAQFGVPAARLTMQAASIPPATKFGTADAQLHLHSSAKGWQAARFGTPLVMRQGNAEGFCTTKFGTPSTQGSLAVQAQGFQGMQWGTHTMAITVHALPMAPGTRFGRPKRTWSIEC